MQFLVLFIINNNNLAKNQNQEVIKELEVFSSEHNFDKRLLLMTPIQQKMHRGVCTFLLQIIVKLN